MGRYFLHWVEDCFFDIANNSPLLPRHWNLIVKCLLSSVRQLNKCEVGIILDSFQATCFHFCQLLPQGRHVSPHCPENCSLLCFLSVPLFPTAVFKLECYSLDMSEQGGEILISGYQTYIFKQQQQQKQNKLSQNFLMIWSDGYTHSSFGFSVTRHGWEWQVMGFQKGELKLPVYVRSTCTVPTY